MFGSDFWVVGCVKCLWWIGCSGGCLTVSWELGREGGCLVSGVVKFGGILGAVWRSV